MNIADKKHRILSYGTLKRGFPNYGVMEEIGAVFIAEIRTKYRFPLFVGGQWQVPFLIDQKDAEGSHIVEGELFEVNAHGLHLLDAFERVSDGFYKRALIEVCRISSHEEEVVWCYFGGAESETIMPESDHMLSLYSTTEVERYTPVWERPE